MFFLNTLQETEMNAQAVTERTLGGEKIPESWQQDRKLIRKFFCGQVIDVVEIETNHLKLITQPSGFPIRHHHFFCFDSFDQGTRALLYHETIDPHEEAEISAQPLDRLIEKIKYLAYLMNSKANYWPLVTIETSSNIGNEKEYFGHLINELEGYDIRKNTIEKCTNNDSYKRINIIMDDNTILVKRKLTFTDCYFFARIHNKLL